MLDLLEEELFYVYILIDQDYFVISVIGWRDVYPAFS
jgi:hypothetical protein